MSYPAKAIAESVLEYSLKEKNPITNLQLQKILYYIEIEYLRNHNDYLIDEDFEAWRYGPVIEDVYYDYCLNGPNVITDIYRSDKVLTKDLQKEIRKVVKSKMSLDPWVMVDDTHRVGGAWYITYDGGKGNKKVIDRNLIREKELQRG